LCVQAGENGRGQKQVSAERGREEIAMVFPKSLTKALALIPLISFAVVNNPLTALAQTSSGAGTVVTGEKIDLTVSPALPYDRTTGDKVMLTFTSKGSDGAPIDHLDWLIEISTSGKQIFNLKFHDHDGVLELDVTPKGMSSFDVGRPAQDDPGKLVTSAFPVTGPLFLDNGMYEIKAQIVGIEFKPLSTPVTQDFSISVVPEFPTAILPLVVTLAAAIVATKIRYGRKHSAE
jgi:hypothetical protein